MHGHVLKVPQSEPQTLCSTHRSSANLLCPTVGPVIVGYCRLRMFYIQVENNACRLAAYLMTKAAMEKAVASDNHMRQVQVGVRSPCVCSLNIMSA